MKLVRCNGRTLEMFDIGEPVYRLTAQHFPINSPTPRKVISVQITGRSDPATLLSAPAVTHLL